MDKITVDAGNYQFEIEKELLKEIQPLLDEYKKLKESSKEKAIAPVVTLDGVEYPLENAVKVLKSKTEKLEGEKAALQAICDEKQDYLSPNIVKDRVELLIKVADSLGVEASQLVNDSEETLKEKFIKKKLPKLTTDGISSEKLNAMFEIAEQIEDHQDSIDEQKKNLEQTYLQSNNKPSFPKINLDEQRWSPANKTKGGI